MVGRRQLGHCQSCLRRLCLEKLGCTYGYLIAIGFLVFSLQNRLHLALAQSGLLKTIMIVFQ